MVGWMPYRSQRSETGVCSRRWSRRMAAFSWTGSRFRVFLGMGGPPLEVVAYSSRRLVPFQLKQNMGFLLPLHRRIEIPDFGIGRGQRIKVDSPGPVGQLTGAGC